MKRFAVILLASLFLLSACKTPSPDSTSKEPAQTLRLTTTTSVNDSGLMEYLRPYLLEDTNITLEIVSLGSGAAIEAGQRGDADVLLVHSPVAEDKFVEEGYGIKRSTFMYNYFVLVGPSEDPAMIKDLSAKEAFRKIYDSKALFISRGDNSGTHNKEEAIWKLIGLVYDTASLETDVYVSVGSGMGDTLMMTSEKQAYTLTDLATFLSMKVKLNLEVLVGASEDLRNNYSVIVVNPQKVANVHDETATRFETWLTSERALDLIAEYGKDTYGEALFFVE